MCFELEIENMAHSKATLSFIEIDARYFNL